MDKVLVKSNSPKILFCALIGTALLVFCAYLNPINHYASALLLILCALVSYFYMVLAGVGKNWFDIRPVFSAVWLMTIGLAALRLADYQEPWQSKTWLCMALAYAMFHIGAELGSRFGARIPNNLNHWSGKKFGRVSFAFKKERLFGICLGVTLIGFACFAANACIKGYIPFFASGGNSYATFYTKFYLFAVAACMISGLCYYTLKTQKLAFWKKAVLYVCIVYSTFLFPILIVSRGTFITSALSLSAAVFYLNKRRLWVLIACVVVMGGVYELGSVARGYTEEQLSVFFEPSQITISAPTQGSDGTKPTVPAATEGMPTEENPVEENPVEENPVEENPVEENPTQVISFQLPGQVAFLYSYLTVSHDNFNEAVQNTQSYTYGVRQLAPFNVILRIPYINKAIAAGERYLVRPHLNTTNLIGDAYYDFGIVGVGVLMLLWAFIFAAIQGCYFAGEGPFALLALGNTMTPVALCFFATWMSIFSHWMHWGLILILWMVASISIKPKAK